MRVKNVPYIPSLLNMQQMLSIEGIEEFDVDIASIDESNDPNELVSSKVFQELKPGNERAIAILRADGFSYKVIGEILGISENQVGTILFTLRQRITKKYNPSGKEV